MDLKQGIGSKAGNFLSGKREGEGGERETEIKGTDREIEGRDRKIEGRSRKVEGRKRDRYRDRADNKYPGQRRVAQLVNNKTS